MTYVHYIDKAHKDIEKMQNMTIAQQNEGGLYKNRDKTKEYNYKLNMLNR